MGEIFYAGSCRFLITLVPSSKEKVLKKNFCYLVRLKMMSTVLFGWRLCPAVEREQNRPLFDDWYRYRRLSGRRWSGLPLVLVTQPQKLATCIYWWSFPGCGINNCSGQLCGWTTRRRCEYWMADGFSKKQSEGNKICIQGIDRGVVGYLVRNCQYSLSVVNPEVVILEVAASWDKKLFLDRVFRLCRMLLPIKTKSRFCSSSKYCGHVWSLIITKNKQSLTWDFSQVPCLSGGNQMTEKAFTQEATQLLSLDGSQKKAFKRWNFFLYECL